MLDRLITLLYAWMARALLHGILAGQGGALPVTRLEAEWRLLLRETIREGRREGRLRCVRGWVIDGPSVPVWAMDADPHQP